VRSKSGKLRDFKAKHAGAGGGEGTWPLVINDAGDVAGFVLDDALVVHGFVRTP
jgi:hypothetical protein